MEQTGREGGREEGQLGGRGQASEPPGSFKGSNFLVDGEAVWYPSPYVPHPGPCLKHTLKGHTHLLRDRPLVSLGKQTHRVKLSTAQIGTLRCLLAYCQAEESKRR